MKPTLFLDIDGVLNNNRLIADYGKDAVGKAQVDVLNTIIDQTDCQIVVSSDWRKFHTVDWLNFHLGQFGFRHTIIGATVDSHYDLPRWQEIQQWVDDNGVQKFVILDDLDCFGPLTKFLVRTSDRLGLQPKHVKSVKRVLGLI